MELIALKIPGAWHIRPAPVADRRGAFARLFCAERFAAHGLVTHWAQMNRSVTRHAGTVRGMHLQRAPADEAKLVRCTAGQVFDVIVDLRPGSPSRGLWQALTLDAEAGEMAYIPPGCAHGFQALTDGVELHYCHSSPHSPAHEAGVHPADPALAIPWPLPVAALSTRDAALPALAAVCQQGLAPFEAPPLTPPRGARAGTAAPGAGSVETRSPALPEPRP